MFGETDSESPRMPSPWDALAVLSSTSNLTGPRTTPIPSPLCLPSPSGSPGSCNLDQPHSLPANPTTLPEIDAPVKNVSGAFSDTKMPLLDSELERVASDIAITAVQTLKLVPEIEEGNVEYKLKLINPTADRFMKLVTQLKYRLLEGGGQALYEIGVSDNGQLVGLSRTELHESLDTLERMAGELGATVVVLKEIMLPSDAAPGSLTTSQLEKIKSAGKAKARKGKKEGSSAGGNAPKGKLKPNRRVNHLYAEPGSRSQDKLENGEEDSPIDSGVDLSTTLSVQQQNVSSSSPPLLSVTSPLKPRSPRPIPVIKNYPYGHKPFVSSRCRLGSDSDRAAVPTSGEEYFYTTSDAKPDTDASKGEDADDDGFGFGFDLDISSFTKSSNVSVATSYLAPSPHVKPSHAKKPLHYSSFPSQNVQAETLSRNHRSGHSNSTNAFKAQINANDGSALLAIKAPALLTPQEKALERRLKRDAKREEKRINLNQRQEYEKTSVQETTCIPPIQQAGLGKQIENENLSTQVPALQINRLDEQKNQTEGEGARFMAEALVVRKLALDEAFLDFGGFGVTLPGEDGEDTDSLIKY